MPTQIDTSTVQDATATSGGPLVALAPSDESANVMIYSGAGYDLATAQSPYTSWSTQAVGSASTRNSKSLLAHTADDNLDAQIASPAIGPYQVTGTRSGNSWTLGLIGQIDPTYEADTTGNGVAAWEGKDAQGRLWALGLDSVNNPYQIWCDFYNGSAWASGGAAIEGLDLGENNRRGVAAAIIGNYLVVVYDSGSGGLKYLRADVHGATIGAWSSAAAVGSVSDATTASVLGMAPIPGGSTGALVYTGGDGVSALVYDAVADSWGAATVLSSAANDIHPTAIPGASGVVYVVWCQFAAANSYALVFKALRSGTWDASPTQIVASGNNLAWPSGAYNASGSALALVWTQGTSSPYSVEFESYTLSSAVNLSGTLAMDLSLSGSLPITRQLGGVLAMDLSLSGTSQVTRALRGTLALDLELEGRLSGVQSGNSGLPYWPHHRFGTQL